MDWNGIIGLFGAYGFEVAKDVPDQFMMRFQGETTFIDVWKSRKGTTLGIYNPKTARMWYERNVTPEKIEDILIKQNNH